MNVLMTPIIVKIFIDKICHMGFQNCCKSDLIFCKVILENYVEEKKRKKLVLSGQCITKIKY